MPSPVKSQPVSSTVAWRRLTELARHPHDLTAPGGFSPERIAKLRAQACGLDILYAAQRVTPEVLVALTDLARETNVIERFRDLLRGAISNRIEGYPSENRRVLHFANRHLFDDLPDRADVRMPQDAVDDSRREMVRLAKFLEGVEQGTVTNAKGEPFNELINLGVGGSALGPRAIYLALQPWRYRDRRVHFVSNLDPDDAAATLRQAHLPRTLVTVVSKSGSTQETRTNEALLRDAYRRAGLDPNVHFTCVTAVGSPLDKEPSYREKFHMFDYVGGRYSPTSVVGGVSLGFGLGFSAFEDLLRGAREMDLASLDLDLGANLPLLMALLGIWNRNFLGADTLAVIPYSQALSRFVAHLQQLDMESNGKSITTAGVPVAWGTGPVVWGEPGTNGQHAFFQLIHQGPGLIPCEFIGFRESQYEEDEVIDGSTNQQKLLANLFGQVLALAVGKPDTNPNKRFAGNRPTLTILGDRLTPRMMGRLLAMYENKVAYQGLVWGINSFDQEGVELGKRLTLRVLPHLAQSHADSGAGSDAVERALLRAARLLPD